MPIALLTLAVVAVGAGNLAFSGASYTAARSNPANSFAASSQFSLRYASGSYTGNGSDDRTITGVGFQPDVVLIKGDNTQVAVMRTATMSGDYTKPLTLSSFGIQAALTPNQIQSLDSNGFTLGTHSAVNSSGTAYQWAAFQRGRQLRLGTYTGNGSSQSISGLGFQPEFVAVLGSGTQTPMLRIAGMTSSYGFGLDNGGSTRITSLDADGFTVGSSSNANASGVTYHYLAFDKVAGVVQTGSYTGNAIDNTNVAGVGFQPEFVLARADDTSSFRRGVWRTQSLTGDSTLYFSPAANGSNLIQALQADGFQIGTDGNVNASGVSYYTLAVKDPGP